MWMSACVIASESLCDKAEGFALLNQCLMLCSTLHRIYARHLQYYCEHDCMDPMALLWLYHSNQPRTQASQHLSMLLAGRPR